MSKRAKEQEQERRTISHPVELRAGKAGAETVIEGYAALFNVMSDDLGGFREVIIPGAFKERLADDVRALWQHDPLYVFGRTTSGTLELREDDTGLRYRVETPDAQWARDALASIRRGDVNQSSFAFAITDGAQWDLGKDGQVTRTITRVARLYDVSPVTFPAYPETSADVRSWVDQLRAQSSTPDKAEAEQARARQDLLKLRVRIREMEV